MSQHNMDDTKGAIRSVLYDAQSPLPAADFLERIVNKGYQQDEVVSVLRQMFEAGDIRFDGDMHLCLTRAMA